MSKKPKHSRIAIIKLAAIGDVAVAARALSRFYNSHELPEGINFHWVIDERYIDLAKSLLEFEHRGIVEFYGIDSEKLFQSTGFDRIAQSLKIFKRVYSINPRWVVLLHRDWRYKALIRGTMRGTMIDIPRTDRKELEIYRGAFKNLAVQMDLSAADNYPDPPKDPGPSQQIGLLIGGARSSKVTFKEKRWPHMTSLVQILLNETEYHVNLYGGQEDIETANDILNSLTDEQIASGRIDNLVGTVSLDNLGKNLANLDAFISVDSGLAHIAAGVMRFSHQKVITLFGPTDPHLWSPVSRGKAKSIDLYKFETCSPCYNNDGKFKPCIHQGDNFQICMSGITPQDVLEALTTGVAE